MGRRFEVADGDERWNRRTELIRKLCVGQGMSPDQLLYQAPFIEDLFECTLEEFEPKLKRAIESMIDSAEKRAIVNALGYGDIKGTDKLTDRRNAFLDSEWGLPVSYRTLIRHEEEGARLLAWQLQSEARVAADWQAQNDRAAESARSAEEEIADLKRRVTELERIAKDVITLIDEGVVRLRPSKKYGEG